MEKIHRKFEENDKENLKKRTLKATIQAIELGLIGNYKIIKCLVVAFFEGIIL